MSDIQAGPLKETSPEDEHHAGPLPKAEPARRAQRPQRVKKTWREQRWDRRRRRVHLEELLGWIFVPLILVGVYFGAQGILTAMGTDLDSLIQGVKTAISGGGR